MITTPLRSAPVFTATLNPTVPFPLPEIGSISVIRHRDRAGAAGGAQGVAGGREVEPTRGALRHSEALTFDQDVAFARRRPLIRGDAKLHRRTALP